MKAIKDFWLFWEPNKSLGGERLMEEGNFFVPENGTVDERAPVSRFRGLKNAIAKVMPVVWTILLCAVLLVFAAASVYGIVKFITIL